MKERPLARVTAVLLAGLALSAPLRAAPSAQDLEITDALLEEIAAETRPVLRSALDVALADVPVRLATRIEIENALTAENTPIYVNLGAGEAAEEQARAFATTIGRFLLAKYAFADDEVLVQADAFEDLGELVGIPELASEEVLRAVVLHELVHAADDERHDMQRLFSGCDSADAMRACNAVIEGHAQMVARDLAQRLGCLDGFETFTRAISTPPKMMREGGAGAEMMARTLTAYMAFSYVTGETFFRGLLEVGGAAAVQRAFTEPPRDPVLIANPEWFLHPDRRPSSVFQIDPVLEPFRSSFDDEEWTLNRVTVSPTDLVTAMQPLPAEEIEAIGKSMRQNRVQVATIGAGESQVVLGVFEFGTPAEAAAYRDAYGRLQRARDELMKEGAVRIVSSDYEELTAPDPDGVLVEKLISAGFMQVEVAALCVTRGPLAVEALASNAEDWGIDELLEAALDVLDRLTAPKTAPEAPAEPR